MAFSENLDFQIPLPMPYDFDPFEEDLPLLDEEGTVTGYPYETYCLEGNTLSTQPNKNQLMYECRGKLESVKYFNEKSTAVVIYDEKELITSKGQSGSPLHYEQEGEVDQTIGIHVGLKDKKNYSTLITKNIFLDFIVPTL